MNEWLVTPSGAIKKSEVIMIIPSPIEDENVNIVAITKSGISFVLYSNIPNDNEVLLKIDNLLKEFDEKHQTKTQTRSLKKPSKKDDEPE